MSIILKQVSYTYVQNRFQKVKALEQVSLTIEDGEFVGIMGHTGCGKTTLIQLIAGLLTPDAGQILLDGQDINDSGYDRRILRKNVGVVFQHPEYQLFETTVEKDVAFGLKYSGLNQAEKKERVKHALAQVGLSYEEICRESPLALSGGEKRRVAIAGVLAAQPKILILDEPIAGLDSGSRSDFLNFITGLNKTGVTVIMVSHHADSLCQCARRILVLHQGRIALDGTPKKVFRDTVLTRQLSIDASRPRGIAQQLIQRGLPLSETITVYDELLEEIERVSGSRNANAPSG